MVSCNKHPGVNLLLFLLICEAYRIHVEEPQENAKREFASLLDFLGKLFVAGLVTGRTACDCEVGVGS